MTELLSKEHTILERPFMEFRPFGVDEQGETIRDISGVIVKSNTEYLIEYMTRKGGEPAGRQADQELCRLLNERIRDSAYHVTPDFIRNVWHSYSYEFVCYLREFCIVISGDPDFPAHAAREKHNISPILQILARPFPLEEIYKRWPHFGAKYASGVLDLGVGLVTDHSAVLRLRFTDKALRQFGPYLRRCAWVACNFSKFGLAAVPVHVYGLAAATVRDLSCVVNGDEWCEWELVWSPKEDDDVIRSIRKRVTRLLARLGSVVRS